jgi:predicted RNase H-like HicB family nuclease
MSAYLVIIEGEDGSYSGYCPDLPGCVAAADTPHNVTKLMREAITLHLQSLRTHGEPVPEPHARAEFVEAL